MTRVLLVTGSRALVGSPYEERAKMMLAEHIERLCPSLVVAGDAPGPDSWAIDQAAAIYASTRIYGLDGLVRGASGTVFQAWDPRSSWPAPTRSNPLDRNAAMVRDVAELRAKGAHVEVLWLEAAWSATKGTAHTLAKARAAGLEITRIVFERGK